MSDQSVIRVHVLGCGSSGGVPRIDGDWGSCDPNNPRNRRTRCSILLERASDLTQLESGVATRLLVDTSPDLRHQMLSVGVTSIDGVAFTHTHADQCHGIDDVRAFVYQRRAQLPAFASPETVADLNARFGYIFQTPEGSLYPPLLMMASVPSEGSFQVEGPGGTLQGSIFDVEHGDAPCSGFRFGPLAYTPDVNRLDDIARAHIRGASAWIVDALRPKPHPSHAHLAMTLDWIGEMEPTLGVLTNLHVDMDYESLVGTLPNGVRPAYDCLSITLKEQSGGLVAVDRL